MTRMSSSVMAAVVAVLLASATAAHAVAPETLTTETQAAEVQMETSTTVSETPLLQEGAVVDPTVSVKTTTDNSTVKTITPTEPPSPPAEPVLAPQSALPSTKTGLLTSTSQLTPGGYWTFTAQPMKVEGLSDRKYTAHRITLTNTQPYHIEILNAEVTNALNEQQLANEKAQAKQRTMGFARLATGALGATSYIPGVGGLVTMGRGGLIAAQAVNTASNMTYQMSQVQAMSGNSTGITGQYVQRFNQVVLGPNQTFTFDVVTAKAMQPNLRMVFKNLETSQILDVNQPVVASN